MVRDARLDRRDCRHGVALLSGCGRRFGYRSQSSAHARLGMVPDAKALARTGSSSSEARRGGDQDLVSSSLDDADDEPA